MKHLSQWLNIEGVHDKLIMGVRLNKQNDVFISIMDSEDDSQIEIVFIKTCHMRIDNFLLGNIILDIEVFEADEVDSLEQELRYLLDLSITNPYDQEILEGYKSDFREGNMFFVAFSSSYGLEGALLCEGIEVVK